MRFERARKEPIQVYIYAMMAGPLAHPHKDSQQTTNPRRTSRQGSVTSTRNVPSLNPRRIYFKWLGQTQTGERQITTDIRIKKKGQKERKKKQAARTCIAAPPSVVSHAWCKCLGVTSAKKRSLRSPIRLASVAIGDRRGAVGSCKHGQSSPTLLKPLIHAVIARAFFSLYL